MPVPVSSIRLGKKKKRWSEWAKVLMACILIALLIFAYFFVNTNIFISEEISLKVAEADCVDYDTLNQRLKNEYKDLLMDTSGLAEKIKTEFNCVSDVKVRRHFVNKIDVEVLGREPVAWLVGLGSDERQDLSLLEKEATFSSIELKEQSTSNAFSSDISSHKFLVDKEGVIFLAEPEVSEQQKQLDLPLIYFQSANLEMGKTVDRRLIEGTVKVLEKTKELGLEVKEAKIYPEGVLLINMEPRTIFTLRNKIDDQLASLQLILTQAKIDEDKMEFIDLRFDKPVVRYAPKKN